MRLGPGLFLMLVSIRVITSLNYQPTSVTNRITEYSLALVLLPIAITGLALALAGLRWLVFALWPGKLQITADADALTFALGPMGTHRYPTDRLELHYLFEMDLDAENEDVLYESLLDAEIQMAEMLPRIRVPGEAERLDRRILEFVEGSEKQTADALRPFVAYMRRGREDQPRDADDSEE